MGPRPVMWKCPFLNIFQPKTAVFETANPRQKNPGFGLYIRNDPGTRQVMDKKPFQIKLTEIERGRLEAHRARLGLRSGADVIRAWIAGGSETPVAIPAVSAKKADPAPVSKPYVPVVKPERKRFFGV